MGGKEGRGYSTSPGEHCPSGGSSGLQNAGGSSLCCICLSELGPDVTIPPVVSRSWQLTSLQSFPISH